MTTIMNSFKPHEKRIARKIKETTDIFTIEIDMESNSYPGQFYELSIIGIGEAPISAASSSSEKLKFTIRSIGHVTSKIFEQDVIGVRGPYGNYWPFKEYDRILAIAGGIGIPPIRALIHELDGKKDLWVIYGARTPSDLVYKYEFDQWRNKANLILTVDRGDESWNGKVGLVTKYIPEIPDLKNMAAFLIGPPIMMENSVKDLLKYGLQPENIFLSLERRMECGFGVCGHCNVGHFYVCEDGPIFRYSEVSNLPELFL
jgi:2-polyprenylphenol hydroxylase and related flavodoxin oxidoreductases